MKEIKKQKKKRKVKRRIHQVILVILLLVIAIFAIRCGIKDDKEDHESESISIYEEEVDQITQIDYTQRQEALNAIVEEGKMNVNYSSKAVFEGMNSKKFNIKNILNNHYPIEFQLYDENGSCIYESKQIEPGYEINNIQLQKKLSKGIHDCKLKIGYAEAGNVSSVFPITIEVK